METYCGLALSGQRSGCYPGLCVQAVGSGLCGQPLLARDESALEVAPPAYGVHDDALYKSTAFTFTFFTFHIYTYKWTPNAKNYTRFSFRELCLLLTNFHSD